MKQLLILPAILILYSYAARMLGIYFFWESGYIGWLLFFLFVIFFCIRRIKIKREQKKKVWLERICSLIAGMSIILQVITLCVLPQTGAYEACQRYIISADAFKDELGEVYSFCVEPRGSINMSTSAEGSTGEAGLVVIAKGTKKYIEFEILLVKELQSDWQVVAVSKRW